MSLKTQQEYNKDFYAWAIHNAELIRHGRFTEVDIVHVAEEIESMGKREKRELINRLAILIAHLLKWQYQPEKRGRSWELTLKEQRIKVTRLLEDNPSLKHELESKLNEAYEQATVLAETETLIDESNFPLQCPFSLEECLDQQFFPF